LQVVHPVMVVAVAHCHFAYAQIDVDRPGTLFACFHAVHYSETRQVHYNLTSVTRTGREEIIDRLKIEDGRLRQLYRPSIYFISAVEHVNALVVVADHPRV